MTARGWSRRTSGRTAATRKCSAWITTWRSCTANPGRSGGDGLGPSPRGGDVHGHPSAVLGAARGAYGDAGGTRALIEVLLAHRTLPAGILSEAIAAAVEHACLDADAVIIDARRRARPTPTAAAVEGIEVAELHRYDRPAPSLHGYDDLLTRQVAAR